MSLRIDDPEGYTLAECREIRAAGLPGVGSYTLVLNLEFAVTAPQIETFLRSVDVRVDWGDAAQRMIGFALLEGSSTKPIPSYNSMTLTFRFVLSSAQLEAIEEFRGGGEFKLNLWLNGEIVQREKAKAFSSQGLFTIKQADWIQALEVMNFKKIIIYEMPLPDFSEDSDSVVKHVDRAQMFLYRGLYDDCVGECRKIFELMVGGDDGIVLGSAREKYKDRKSREALLLNERMVLLKDILKLFTHKPNHANHDESYSRDQAKLILGATIAFYSVSLKDA